MAAGFRKFAAKGALLASLLAASGCELTGLSDTDGTGSAPVKPTETAPTAAVSAESQALSQYYARAEQGLIARGLLRTDGGGPDTPVNNLMLAQNFETIALSEELRLKNGRILAGQKTQQLNRWIAPIRIGMHFGETVSLDQQSADRIFVANYLRRLSRLTRHPISLVSENPNFNILVLHEDQRKKAVPFLQAAGIANAGEVGKIFADLDRNTDCVVVTEDAKDDGQITRATVLVRAELGPMLRHACFHEEIAQGLGLFNDGPKIRPSIFNDDNEFGLLTTHDEFLLRILYDSRMRPGMLAAQARQQAEVIATELVGGAS